MLRLDLALSPRWITLMPGVDVQVAPMSSAIWMAAIASPAVQAATLARSATDWTFALGIEIAQRVILDWRGVGDLDGNVLAVSPGGITALLHERDPFDAFYDQYIGPWMQVTDEKKGFAPAPDGNSAGAPSIAAPVTPRARPARAGKTPPKRPKAG